MNAILALSARHLSLETTTHSATGKSNPWSPSAAARTLINPSPSDAVTYYYKTLHYSQKAMQYDTYKTSLELLASSIIISAYEMLDGSSTKDWERHLQGVFWIQRSQVIHGDSGGLRAGVWWAWLCQDVWAAFRERRRPFTFWRPVRTLEDLDPYELAARAAYNFARAVAFCAVDDASSSDDDGQLTLTTPGGHDVAARDAEADALLGALEHWRSHLTVEFEPLPLAAAAAAAAEVETRTAPVSSPPPPAPPVPSMHSDGHGQGFQPLWFHPPVFGLAVMLYHCSAILTHLHRPVLSCASGLDGHLRQRNLLRRHVDAVCGIATGLGDDFASGVMASQCVFIAGLCVESTADRAAVVGILGGCRRRTGWPVRPLEEELQLVWRTGTMAK